MSLCSMCEVAWWSFNLRACDVNLQKCVGEGEGAQSGGTAWPQGGRAAARRRRQRREAPVRALRQLCCLTTRATRSL